MKTILFVLVSLTGVTATISGLIMISSPGGYILNVPPGLPENTPFRNFLIPGILLATVVGGVNLIAVFFHIRRHPQRYNWAMAGGFMISGWILIQFLLVQAAYWWHVIFLGIGLLIILIASQLKGKWVV